MLRRTLCAALMLALLPLTALAAGFVSDVEAINDAAKSVLMLEVRGEGGELISTGSGFVVRDSETLVTNGHVVEGAHAVDAFSDDGYVFPLGSVLLYDEDADIAVLGFETPTDRAPLALVSGEIRRAERVVAIGSPKGLLNTVSMGNVSALFEDEGVSYVQFTAPISSGSSGGALFNDRGEVIGVTTSVYDDGEGVVQNLNFAVDAREIAQRLETLDGARAVTLAAFARGERPSRALINPPASDTPKTPAPTLTPAITPAPAASPAPRVRSLSRVSDVTAEDLGDGRQRVWWRDDGHWRFDFIVAYREAGSTDARTVKVEPVSDDDGRVSAILAAPLEAGRTYYFAVDITAYAAKEAVMQGVWAQNVCAFTPQVGEGLVQSAPAPRQEAAFALEIPEDAYAQWDYERGGVLQIRVQVRNTSAARTVRAFELTMYATDVWGRRLWGEDIGYVFTTSKKVAPGRTVYSDYLNVPDSIKIDRAYFGVSKIAYTDGTVEQAPEIDYSYWQIEE